MNYFLSYTVKKNVEQFFRFMAGSLLQDWLQGRVWTFVHKLLALHVNYVRNSLKVSHLKYVIFNMRKILLIK